MAKVTLEMPTETIRELLAQLSPGELRTIVADLQHRADTWQMMKLAESAFAEWEQEDDFYAHG